MNLNRNEKIKREFSFFVIKLCLLFPFCCTTMLVLGSNTLIYELQQNKTGYVSGVVLDENREPVIGASVIVKGGSNGTITDIDGKFSLNVKAGDVLVISFLGYSTQEIVAVTGEQYTIRLESDTKALEEVVVLGFGQTQKKIAQTGSIATVSSIELKQSPTANVMNALAGRLPGLVTMQRTGAPGQDAPTLYVRGRASLNTSSTPLVTIDGVQREYEAISLLDVNEIENITILKDASATALYGVKGANGVIIVTTKKGTAGKPKINISQETAFSNVVALPKFLDSYNTAILYNEAYKNDNPNATTVPYDEVALEAFRTGSDPLRYANVDYIDELLKTGVETRTNFSISGGDKQVKYFVNVGALNQGGNYNAEKNDLYDANARYKRYNFRSNIDVDFNEQFSIGLKLNGAIQDISRPNATVQNIFITALTVSPTTPIKYPTGYYSYDGQQANPFWFLNTSGYAEEYNSALSGMLTASHKLDFITKGLSIKGNYSFDGKYNSTLVRSMEVPYATYKGYGDYNDPENYTYLKTNIPLSAPKPTFSQIRSIWMDFSLNYQRTFGDHDVSALLLANRTQRVLTSQSTTDATNTIPFVSQGLVMRAVYSYKYKYFTEFNAGYNGTDNFSPDNRYGFFPALSLGWAISEENFLKDVSFLDLLKLRASYGLTGDDQITGRRWLFYSEYLQSGSYLYGATLQSTAAIIEGAMANRDVSWQKSQKSNLGLELKLFNSRIGLTADVFYEYRYDQLIASGTVPGIIGVDQANLPMLNSGKVENKGFEIELTHNNNIGKVNYFLNANFSFARNKIIYMDETPPAHEWLAKTGRSIGQQYGYTWIGFFEDEDDIANSPTQFGNVIPGDLKYADLNVDGVIDENDMGAIGGSTVPEIYYGFSGGFNWNNFDISFLFQGAANGYRNNAGVGYWEFFNGGKVTEAHLGRWTPETASTATYPALHSVRNSNNHKQSTFYQEKTDYLRLKNIEIGYTFRKVNFIGISSIRLYGNGQNLYTWSNTVFDPELTGETYAYPIMRVFNVGLNVAF